MKTPHLVLGTILFTGMAAAGCSREDTDQNARRAAAELRNVAQRARHQLADSWLTTKIQAQYFADDDIKAAEINVSSRDGVVTISGRVDDENTREQALDIARYTDGVRRIEDLLAVGPGPATARTEVAVDASPRPIATTGSRPAAMPPMDDMQIATRIQAKYFLDDAVKTRRIEVDAHDGVVTLRGEVANDHERAQALILARTTEG